MAPALNVTVQINGYDYGTVGQKVASGDYELYNSGVNSMAGDPTKSSPVSPPAPPAPEFLSNPDVDKMIRTRRGHGR